MGGGRTPQAQATQLKGSTVLITGASAGIGAATARAFAEEGAHLVLVARREDRLRTLADALVSEHGINVEVIALDVSDRTAVDTFVKKHAHLVQRVDVLVNNAGFARGIEKMQEGNVEDWEAMMQTNVLGLLYMTRAIIPHMTKRGDGHVVNLGSVSGRWVYPGGGVYCATKHAVRALSEGLRMDLSGTGVRVTNIEPGLAETEFSVVRLGTQDKANKVYADMTPLVARDLAEAIVWSAQRPPHVNIQEMIIYPTDQAAIAQVHRHQEAA